MITLNLIQNNSTTFKATAPAVLTKDLVHSMPAKDILELSTVTIKKQNADIIRALNNKISHFVRVLASQYEYFKSHKLEVSVQEFEKVKADKKKAQKIEKLLNERMREEKIKKGLQLNPNLDDIIPIEYIIAPEEEKFYQKEIKLSDLIIEKRDADRYKHQKAKHDRKIAQSAHARIIQGVKADDRIYNEYGYFFVNFSEIYKTKKLYNHLAENILFTDTTAKLEELQEEINNSKLFPSLKKDLLRLIDRKISLLNK